MEKLKRGSVSCSSRDFILDVLKYNTTERKESFPVQLLARLLY